MVKKTEWHRYAAVHTWADNVKFIELKNAIGTGIEKISKNVNSMQKMASKIGTAKDTSDFKIKLHSMENNTQQLVKDTYGYIKDMNALPVISKYERERKVHRDRLQDEFMATLNNFQVVQKDVVHKVKDTISRGHESTSGHKNQAQHESDTGHKEDQDVRVKEKKSEYEREKKELEATKQLELEAAAVEKHIVEAENLMKDFKTTVIEQASRVNEANVEQASVQQESQRQEARVYRPKQLKKKIILGAIVAVIVIVMIGIIVWLTL